MRTKTRTDNVLEVLVHFLVYNKCLINDAPQKGKNDKKVTNKPTYR